MQNTCLSQQRLRTALYNQTVLHSKTLPQKPKTEIHKRKNALKQTKKPLQTCPQIILKKLPLKKQKPAVCLPASLDNNLPGSASRSHSNCQDKTFKKRDLLREVNSPSRFRDSGIAMQHTDGAAVNTRRQCLRTRSEQWELRAGLGMPVQEVMGT